MNSPKIPKERFDIGQARLEKWRASGLSEDAIAELQKLGLAAPDPEQQRLAELAAEHKEAADIAERLLGLAETFNSLHGVSKFAVVQFRDRL